MPSWPATFDRDMVCDISVESKPKSVKDFKA